MLAYNSHWPFAGFCRWLTAAEQGTPCLTTELSFHEQRLLTGEAKTQLPHGPTTQSTGSLLLLLSEILKECSSKQDIKPEKHLTFQIVVKLFSIRYWSQGIKTLWHAIKWIITIFQLFSLDWRSNEVLGYFKVQNMISECTFLKSFWCWRLYLIFI